VKKEMKNHKKIVSLLVISTFCLILTNPVNDIRLIQPIPFVEAEGIASAWHNNSSLSVHIIHSAPRINWYDIQYNDSGTWVSKLNKQIDVDNHSEYRFIVNISSDQGWDDIEFINLTAWFDNGTELSYYNETLGGNFNLYMQYENTTSTSDTPVFRNIWPNDEIQFGSHESRVVNDTKFGLEGVTEARNITFTFIPNKQFRYAPGEDSTWNESVFLVGNSSKYGLFNNFSWNFNISVTDSGEDNGGVCLTSWVADEFGVYAYSEILSAQNPSIVGYPGNNYSVIDSGGSGNVSLVTCSNGNYSLSVDVSDLAHETLPSHIISKSNVYVKGGNRTTFRSLLNSVYLYGGSQDGLPDYHIAEAWGNLVNTSNIEYTCYIPLGQLAGEYSSHIYYHLSVEE
jgi:hypothetical protein